jgi:HEAT repeats
MNLAQVTRDPGRGPIKVGKLFMVRTHTTMQRRARLSVLALGILLAGGPAGAQPTSDLIQKLGEGSDFRVRVQAALELGKTRGSAQREALESALDDENAAVRAAAAAGLKVMRDPLAVAALRRHETDGSPAVRSQIKTTLEALQAGGGPAGTQGQSATRPDVIVQLGKIRSSSTMMTVTVLEDVARTSRQKLRELPGVAVMDEGKETAPSSRLPTIMVTGRVKQLEQSREGTTVVYLASIEFVLHKMPGQTIKGVVSGSARASGSAEEMSSAGAIADLRKTAIEAAIDSAIRRAPQALRAAAQ